MALNYCLPLNNYSLLINQVNKKCGDLTLFYFFKKDL